MAALTAGLIGAGLASSIGGSIIGGIASGDDKKKAQEALDRADAIINNLQLPPDQSRPIIIQELKSAGVWKPEMEQHIDAGISKVSQIKEDPAFKEKQMATLNALQQIADTGMTATGRAEYNKVRAQAQQDAEAKRQQILQQMQMRGMGGSGAELAAQLSAAQGSANEQAAAADRIAAEQEQAKMSALGQLGGLAGQVRGQEFGIEQAKAGAADAFKMFDVQNQLAQQARNVASKNEAAKYDVMNQQRLSDANIAAANQELQRQRQGEMQNYAAAAQRAGLQAQQAGARAGQYQQQAQNTAQGWANMGSGLGGMLTTIAGKTMGKEKAPTSVSSLTPEQKKAALLASPDDKEVDLGDYS